MGRFEVVLNVAHPAPATRRTDRLQRTDHEDQASDYLGHAESPTPTLADLTRPAR
jgi:hypothetical protein